MRNLKSVGSVDALSFLLSFAPLSSLPPSFLPPSLSSLPPSLPLLPPSLPPSSLSLLPPSLPSLTDLQPNIDHALQATQLQLKKNKLADTLNDKLANRPGPLQLLQNGIIEPHLSEVVKGYELDASIPGRDMPTTTAAAAVVTSSSSPSSGGEGTSLGKIPEIAFEGFGSGLGAATITTTASPSSSLNSTSQQRPILQQRHSIAGPSPADMFNSMDTSPSPSEAAAAAMIASATAAMRKTSESSISPAPSPSPVGGFEEARSPEKSPRSFNSTYPPMLKTSLSTGVLQSLAKSCSSPSTSRKKQPKKYRKLRYHEYVPPSKSTPKGGKTNPKPPAKTDGPYAAILQQQQLFLQLQVLQEQYPDGILMQKLPEMINSLSKEQKALAFAAAKGRLSVTSPSEVKQPNATLPQVLPVEMPNKHNTSSVRFEDLKVNDLKTACKERNMIVSGKKAELVERLMDHNKGLLPASALPESLKDSRRQAFSMGQGSSVESQFSTSPTSPNTSPVFKFPSEQPHHHHPTHHPSHHPHPHHHTMDGTSMATTLTSSASVGSKLSSRVPLPEVFPASNLHKEFNEMVERQKRNYICQQRGLSEKSIAPRPELNDLLAIKLPYTTTASTTASHVEQQQPQQQRVNGKGGTLPGNGRPVDSRSQMLLSDKSASRSLPASPKPGSPAAGNTLDAGSELMDSGTPDGVEASGLPSLSSGGSGFSGATPTSEVELQRFSSLPTSVSVLSQSTAVVGGVSKVGVSGGESTYTTSFYHQETTPLQGKASATRPTRSSVPAQTQAGHASVGGPPSYSSIMRSRSIVGTHPNVGPLSNRMNK